MDIITSQLSILGIIGKDAEVYIELLKLKEATVIQLAKATKIKRTSVYYCLDSLIQKGLISQISKNNKKLFVVEEPKTSLNTLIESQKSAVGELLPQISKIYGKGTDLPEIKIYYNISGIKRIFEDVLDCKEKIGRYFVSDINIDELLGEAYLKGFVKKRIAMGIKSMSLRSNDYLPEREDGKNQNYQLREVRTMPNGIKIAPYLCVYDNKCVMISAKEHYGFIIESNEFAEAQKAIFDSIWNISTKAGIT